MGLVTKCCGVPPGAEHAPNCISRPQPGDYVPDIFGEPAVKAELERSHANAKMIAGAADRMRAHERTQDAMLRDATKRADSAELTDEDYADVHSLDRQRYYNILCLIYGSDSAGYADLVEDGDLPEGRAETCEYEFAQKTDSWTRLLGSNLVAVP